MKIKDRIKSLRRVAAKDLIPNPKNWRTHPKGQQDALRGILGEIGFADAVLARETDGGLMLIDGHLRAEVAPEAKIPVLVLDVTEDEADKILATHDPLAAMAGADVEQLAELSRGLEFASDDVTKMLDDLLPACREEAEQDDVPDVSDELREKWQTESGQIWTIGRHRLLIGDSTKQDQVARLLHGSVPYLMVTDPPYGVEYDPAWRNRAGLKNPGKDGVVNNDDTKDWSAAYALFPGAVAYVWFASWFIGHVHDQLTSLSFEPRSLIIWAKPRFSISRGHYHWQHEPCWYAVKRGQPANWCGDRSQTTLWNINPTTDDAENLSHSTMKPVECMARPIRNHTGDVYDPFIGSGTTMVAAEQLGRRCFGMEISPKYGAVVLERMARFNEIEINCERAKTNTVASTIA